MVWLRTRCVDQWSECIQGRISEERGGVDIDAPARVPQHEAAPCLHRVPRMETLRSIDLREGRTSTLCEHGIARRGIGDVGPEALRL